MHCAAVGSCREDKLTRLTAVAATRDDGGKMVARSVALDVQLLLTRRR